MKASKALSYLAFAGALAVANIASASSVTGDKQLVLDMSNLFDQDVEHSSTHTTGSSFTEQFGLTLLGPVYAANMTTSADSGGVGTAKFNFTSFKLLDGSSNLITTGTLVDDGLGNFTQATLSIQNLSTGSYIIEVAGTTLAGGKYDVNVASAVPVPAAVWLFGSAMAGLTGMRRKTAVAA